MSFEVTVTPTVYDVEVAVNPSVQPFDVEVTVGNVPDLDLTTVGDSGASTFDPLTGELNIPEYTLDGLGGVPESRTITINGTTQDLSADRTFTIPAPDPVTIGSPANGLAIDGNQVLTIGLASSGANGALSSTDWSTFNNKQDAIGYTPENVANKAINLTSPDDTKYPTTLAVSTALAGKQDLLTNPITGTGTSGQVSFWTGTGTQSGDNALFWDDVNKRLGIGTNAPGAYTLDVNGLVRTRTLRLLSVNDTLEFANTLVRISRVSNRMFFYGFAGFDWIDSNSGVAIMRLFDSTGNLLLQNGGTFTDAGFRLDVNGTARVQGALSVTTGADVTPLTISGYSLTGSNNQSALSITGTWNTTGTPTAILLNITDTASASDSILMNLQVGGSNRFRFRKDGVFSFGGGGAIAQIRGNINESFDMRSPASGTASDFIFQNGLIGSRNHTSGNVTGLELRFNYQPTSGTGSYSGLVYVPIINQTGGASGITRGIRIAPTLTSAADWRSIEWSNNTGRGLWGVGTANNAIAGALNVGSATNANASAILELTSTSRGLLPPRMTGAQAEAISSPAEGLLVYSTDGTGTTITSKGWWGFNGSTWAQLN